MPSGMSLPSVSGVSSTSAPAVKLTAPHTEYGRKMAEPTPAEAPSMSIKGAEMEPRRQALLQMPSAVARTGVGYNSAVYVGVAARDAEDREREKHHGRAE